MIGIITRQCTFTGISGLLLFGIFCFTFQVKAEIIPDTIHIHEVVISSENISKFQAGAKIESIQAHQIEILQDGNLERVLNRLTPVALKTMAGGFSTIRFRGTSPNHTSINFGGINLNSLTLGNSNISNIPMYLFDKVGIQYGSSSAVNGSGNIGGAIHLGLENYWVDGFKAEVRASVGSIGEQLYGTKLFFGNGKWESVTRAYYYYNKNQFKYYYEDYKDFDTGKKGLEDVQQNAAIENKGIIQEFNYRFHDLEKFKLMAWIEDDWQLIQQDMATNADTSKKDYTEPMEEFNTRIWAAYNNRKNALKYHAGAGYVFDNSVWNNSTDKIETQRFISDIYGEYDLLLHTSFKAGVKLQTIMPDVYAYSESLTHENRIDAFLMVKQEFFNKLTATLNMRSEYVTGFNVPFTPALGISYLAYSSETGIVRILANIAKNYRIPTFNDRFWIPGGNPNLLPEKGMNYEAGFKYSHCNKNRSGNLGINAFYMDIDDWILWRNMGSYWAAENVQHVISKGLEFSMDANFDLHRVALNAGGVYAYTSTQRVESDNETDPLYRQLEYVPLHSAKLFATATYQKWSGGIDGQVYPWQYTDGTYENVLEGYFLLNLNAQRQILVNENNSLHIRALFNNIMNVNYQSSLGYAMPRFNFNISITYNFK